VPARSPSTDIRQTLDAIWRIESAQLIARLMRLVRDLGAAEDLAQDAFVEALAQWPESGIPRNPAAWLTTVAKRRAIDRMRRAEVLDRKYEESARELRSTNGATPAPGPDDDFGGDDDIGDDLLRLMFVACHPVLSREARVALTLRVLGGLTTGEIARAFLVAEPVVAQRIVRAKRTLSEARVPFEFPSAAERALRLASVLEVLYLIFNEGYAATAGDDVLRPALCDDSIRLGRILAKLAPADPEVHGLVALMELQASRTRARVDPSGAPILLLEQDRGKWDHVLVQRGLAALALAEKLGGGAFGPYALQAAIAACHARARTADETDWPRIAALYDALAELLPTPVVQLNRAVAIGMAYGAAASLELVDALATEPALKTYHLLPSVRADLLEKLGRFSEARDEFERAAALAHNLRDRELLHHRAARCSIR
jgi:RNA polymerase sigma factor (sigma-70 family)